MGNAPICGATRRDGSPCASRVRVAGESCWAHDPRNAEKRKANARKAAQAKNAKPTEIAEVKAELRDLADQVKAGKIKPGIASVSAQVYGVLLRCYEQERKIKETEELQARLEALEEAQKRRNGLRGV